MKKYTLVLVALAFVLGSFPINTNSANAIAGAYSDIPGCTLPGQAYSVTTGQACGSSSVIVCAPGDLFSSVTGVPCGTVPTFPPGCTSTSGFSTLTGQSCGGPIPPFPCPVMYTTDVSSTSYGYKCPPVYSSVVISGVSGPQTLNVNQQGTWTVSAYSKNGGNLSYQVSWGDEGYYSPAVGGMVSTSPAQQSATFTHSYNRSGTYTVIFTVTDANAKSGQSAQTSLTVNVGNVTNSSSITVLYPNGGEVWTKGGDQTIRWMDRSDISTHEIKLISYTTKIITPPVECFVAPCPVAANTYPVPVVIYTIGNTQGSSFVWTGGRDLSGRIIPEGAYTLQVCQTGSNNCDSSDSYLKIVSGSVGVSVMVSSTTDNPPAGSILVNPTASTNGVTLLKFSLQANNSNLTLKKLPIQITTTGHNVSSVISTLKLYKDSVLVDALDGSAATTCGGSGGSNGSYSSSCEFIFSNLASPGNIISAGSIAKYSVVVDLKQVNGNYSLGDSITAAFTSTDVLSSFNFSVVDANGNQLAGNSGYRMGSAYGQPQTLVSDTVSNGVQMTMGTPSYTTVTDGGQVIKVNYSIPLSLTAIGQTLYLPQTSQKSSTISGQNGIAFVFQDSNSPTTDLTNGVSLQTLSSYDAVVEGYAYRLDGGVTKHFTLSVALTTPATSGHSYRVALKQFQTFVNYSFTTGATTYTLLPPANYQTAYQYITTSTPPVLCLDPNATNYRGTLPCIYPSTPPNLCLDPNASNYRGTLPCIYQTQLPLSLSAYRDSSSPAGNIGSGTQVELLRFRLTASRDAALQKLNFQLVGTGIKYISNISVYVSGGYLGKISDLVNTSSWYYNGSMTLNGFTFSLPANSSKDISVRADISNAAEALNSWMWINLNSAETDLSPMLSGFPVSGNQVNISSTTSGGGTSVDSSIKYRLPPVDPVILPPISGSPDYGSTTIISGTDGRVQGAESFNFTQKLQLGSTGAEVTELQKFLTGRGYYSGNIDGNFGLQTQAALIKFEVAKNLTPDGIMGIDVRALLNR